MIVTGWRTRIDSIYRYIAILSIKIFHFYIPLSIDHDITLLYFNNIEESQYRRNISLNIIGNTGWARWEAFCVLSVQALPSISEEAHPSW